MFMYGAWRDIWKGKRRRGSEFKQVSELQGCKVSSFEFRVSSFESQVSSFESETSGCCEREFEGETPIHPSKPKPGLPGTPGLGTAGEDAGATGSEVQSCKVSSVKAKAAGRGVRATRDDSQVSVSRTDANLE
jgi:hypothetical protein